VSRTGVLYNVSTSISKSCSQPDLGLDGLVDTDLSWTISRAQSDVRTPQFRHSYLKANKVNKKWRDQKDEYVYHFWKCANAITKISKIVSHACQNYSLL